MFYFSLGLWRATEINRLSTTTMNKNYQISPCTYITFNRIASIPGELWFRHCFSNSLDIKKKNKYHTAQLDPIIFRGIYVQNAIEAIESWQVSAIHRCQYLLWKLDTMCSRAEAFLTSVSRKTHVSPEVKCWSSDHRDLQDFLIQK